MHQISLSLSLSLFEDAFSPSLATLAPPPLPSLTLTHRLTQPRPSPFLILAPRPQITRTSPFTPRPHLTPLPAPTRFPAPHLSPSPTPHPRTHRGHLPRPTKWMVTCFPFPYVMQSTWQRAGVNNKKVSALCACTLLWLNARAKFGVRVIACIILG